MDIYNSKALATAVSSEVKFYDRVVRFKRGERKCFSKSEIATLKGVVESAKKDLIAALSECTPNDKKSK